MTSRVEELQRMCDNINENGGLDSGEWHTALLAQIAQNLAVIADVMMADGKTENSSEKPNNCEHITEDGVTCAKYPACDDCLDNPLNKLKGSERLLKGSEQTDLVEDSPSLVKDLVKAFGEDGTWLERQGVYTLTLAEAKQRAVDIIESVLAKTEPQNYCDDCLYTDTCDSKEFFYACTSKATISKMEQVAKDINVRSKDEPQTERSNNADHIE